MSDLATTRSNGAGPSLRAEPGPMLRIRRVPGSRASRPLFVTSARKMRPRRARSPRCRKTLQTPRSLHCFTSLAMKIGNKRIKPLQRNIVVLLPGIIELLVAQHRQHAREALAGGVGHDDFVDIAAFGGD